MSAIIRTLIVWLMLLAVPFQGFASAAMLPCAPVPQAPAATMHSAHQHHDLAASGHHGAAATHAHHDSTPKHSHSKCGTCASCCVGAAMAPPLLAVAAPHIAPTRAAPVDAGHVPSVDLDLPERPPRTARA